MNLIEQFGSYEEAKSSYEWLMQKGYCGGNLDDGALKAELLEYRKQYNIFEVGDLVVDTNYKDSDVQEIKSISGNRMNVFHKNKAYYFATFVFSFRHATDAEIKVGHRL